jgi:hypothetical protein
MMKWYEWLAVAVLLLFIYKRAEGYGNIYEGSLDSEWVPGGRPAEIFNTLSPSEWQQKDVSYAHWSNKISC